MACDPLRPGCPRRLLPASAGGGRRAGAGGHRPHRCQDPGRGWQVGGRVVPAQLPGCHPMLLAWSRRCSHSRHHARHPPSPQAGSHDPAALPVAPQACGGSQHLAFPLQSALWQGHHLLPDARRLGQHLPGTLGSRPAAPFSTVARSNPAVAEAIPVLVAHPCLPVFCHVPPPTPHPTPHTHTLSPPVEQAANIQEALEAGAATLLVDEVRRACAQIALLACACRRTSPPAQEPCCAGSEGV